MVNAAAVAWTNGQVELAEALWRSVLAALNGNVLLDDGSES